MPPTDGAYHEGRKRLIGDVRWLYGALRAIPRLEVYPTGANFVLFKIQNGMTATELQTRLLDEHQMYVRDCSNKLGMDNFHIRVASQGREKDARLVDALQDTDAMKRPVVLVAARRTTRKNKFIDYVGELHLDLLIRLRTLPVIVPVVEGTTACLPQYMEQMDGLLLVEGEDIEPKRYTAQKANFQYLEKTHPLKDEIEIRLLRHALRREVPILGICRGSQLLNVVCGGTLYGDVQKEKRSRRKHIDYHHYDTYRHPSPSFPELLSNVGTAGRRCA